MIHKIRLLSDIHEEFGPLEITKLDTDKDTILVIAGDFQVSAGPDQQDRIAALCEQFKAVVYIPGNHDYYGCTIQDVDDAWMIFGDSHPNFHYLNPGKAIIDGLRFIGGILWTDLKGNDPIIRNLAQSRMNDYRQIRTIATDLDGNEVRRKITPTDIFQINYQHRRAFERFLDEPFKGSTVMVTHHAPSMICTGNDSRYSDCDRGLDFCYGNTGLEEWFETKPIHLWVHGHIHQWQVNELNDIPIVARPRGYHNYEELAAWYEKHHADKEIIEVSDEA